MLSTPSLYLDSLSHEQERRRTFYRDATWHRLGAPTEWITLSSALDLEKWTSIETRASFAPDSRNIVIRKRKCPYQIETARNQQDFTHIIVLHELTGPLDIPGRDQSLVPPRSLSFSHAAMKSGYFPVPGTYPRGLLRIWLDSVCMRDQLQDLNRWRAGGWSRMSVCADHLSESKGLDQHDLIEP